ncbi:hypothetical protein OPV22_031556 [Ensete ventricosum]|uniref:Uncharacterized protein n=1 Tax=Ensete ventricosum TaxID=4639 RepID=A0AAV8PMM3_ENSVE|nr:hypothetical protein OPV22_031556 [Ensete ventricosum]
MSDAIKTPRVHSTVFASVISEMLAKVKSSIGRVRVLSSISTCYRKEASSLSLAFNSTETWHWKNPKNISWFALLHLIGEDDGLEQFASVTPPFILEHNI